MTDEPRWRGTAAHARWLEQETDALLQFARSARADLGFAYLDAAGQPEPDRPTELWILCRMVHAFSLGTLLGRPGCAPLVDHGLAALAGAFTDGTHGGWFAKVGPDGPVEDAKEAYAHAFVLLATSSAAAAGRPGAAELFRAAQDVSSTHFWREEEGMVVEGWDRSFTECEDYRGLNANMHTVEAYLATADVSGEDLWLDRAVRILRRVVDGIARETSWRINEHFDPSWRPLPDYNRDDPAHPFRPYGATVGHWFEWARLTLQARDAWVGRGRTAEPWMLEGARALFAAGVAEGWAVDGADGFLYTVDFDGVPVVRERMHWVLAEAIGAAAALHIATGEDEYARWYRTCWDYAAEYFIETPGAWLHELSPSNTTSATTWPGKPDIYHAIQATLVPRLPLSPALAPSLAAGNLDASRGTHHRPGAH